MRFQAQQRVRRLLLQAPQAELLQRGRILLEDAFHTTSVADANGSRLLLIRSLKLGRIPSHLSSASIALLIEKRLTQLQSSAVYALSGAASTAPVVYFQNDVEPFLHLAVRVARQASSLEWFWPLAVPGWNSALPRAAALRHLLFGAAQTSVGSEGSLVLALTLLEQGVIEPLLEALREEDGVLLLGWLTGNHATPPQNFGAATLHAPAVSFSLLLPAVRRWFLQWGAQDARSHWLASLCLLQAQPHRRSDPLLAQHAAQLVQTLVARLPVASVPMDEAATASAMSEPIVPSVAERTRGAFGTASPETASQGAKSAAATMVQPQTETPTEAKAEAIRTKSETPLTVAGELAPEVCERPPSSLAKTLNALAQPDITNRAGLFFLLPVLSRLGLQDWLQQYPSLLEIDFPTHLLRYVCARLATPEDDLIWQMLAATSLPLNLGLATFVVPPQWAQALSSTGPHQLCRRAHQPERQVLCDQSRRLIFAQWQGLLPDGVAAFQSTSAWVQGRDIVSTSDLELICQTWFTALRRWCRRAVRIGLSEVVCRPGRIAVTRTHLDVFFTLQQADIRIRRTGLDLDPGWIPWFGKVVSFYYRDGEQ